MYTERLKKTHNHNPAKHKHKKVEGLDTKTLKTTRDK